ncbi:hypothetical protein ACOMICROBIO_FLGHMIGD_04194 [Vibrio sp. B1FLJ16]|uniref:DUF3319 domain-containing protein n=1 Tax=Vibrio sp. B1FLJ16 TaxID=2751178 RepID=UPI0015F74C18|nr:DUF3319 domain-containing protein [Vibrio sp. B1FLJ16]CAD7820549.1 hypothetical protein ACOMICROBIO_FLGHMIGD_04194 [Vibrio sp. B1FLJ16]CAE6943403.1 hypothetical protein ACOMICROBIO_FLGHMIGD_04194 [Vibrio sp. B1FLJ16]
MAVTIYRGYRLQSNLEGNLWKVRLKNQVLQGTLTAVKKSIDWWCDTASIIEPKEFELLSPRYTNTSVEQSELFNGYTLRNDTGEKNAWYCMFNGKLIKGGKLAIQRYIEAYLAAKQKALLAQQQKK